MQGFLGTTSTNPIFYVEHNREDGIYNIYFGIMLFASITDDKRSLTFKSTIAILANAGVRLTHIEKNFDISYESIIKYKQAFDESKDDIELQKRLKNPGGKTKITDEIRVFIYERTEFHQSQGEYHYIKKSIIDIEEKFGIKLSRETIRLELKKKSADKKSKNSVSNNIAKGNCKEPDKVDKLERDIATSNSLISTSEFSDRTRNNYAGLLLLSSSLSLLLKDFPSFSLKNNKYSSFTKTRKAYQITSKKFDFSQFFLKI
jgi:transposase